MNHDRYSLESILVWIVVLVVVVGSAGAYALVAYRYMEALTQRLFG